MTRVPSSETRVGDRVRECWDSHARHAQACKTAIIISPHWTVMAFDYQTGEAYVDDPQTPLFAPRRIRSWVRVLPPSE